MTVLMPSWYYEKKDLKRSPSILDGLDVERESRYRREGARFIINVGTKMGLRYDTMATGVVYFHRFYMFHTFKTFPRYVTACCCLFLAGKVEETPKKCKDIIRIAKTFLADSQLTQFGDDPKEEVMTLERILLQTIKFDLQVDHPYSHLLRYAKSLKGDKVKLQNMVQMAWTFINDSLCTTLCLQFEPEVIAIALIYLAGKLSKFEVVDWMGRTPRHNHWWDMFVEGMSIELLEDICHQVLDLYSTPMANTPQDSPPATPPTKSTRKTSQPSSPIEAAASPAPPKPIEVLVGQPIPRLEPTKTLPKPELKRKAPAPEHKKEAPEPKLPRIAEVGKAIPTITTTNISPKGSSNPGSDSQPSPPMSPIAAEPPPPKSLPKPEVIARSSSSEAAYRSGIGQSVQPMPEKPPPPPKPVQKAPLIATAPVSSFTPTVPPPSATYAQASAYYENQGFPNMQQPPPQIYPMQFQHPPPPVPPSVPPPVAPPPSGPPPTLHRPVAPFTEPPPQYPPSLPTGVPAFNSQFPPPPRHQPPPPPPGMLGSAPPVPGMTSHPPPRPQGMPPMGMQPAGRPPRMMSDNLYSPRPPGPEFERGGRGPPDHRQPRARYEGDAGFRGGRRDSDGPFPLEPHFDPGFNRPPRPMQFGPGFDRPPRPPPPPRRFPHDPHHERGPRPPMPPPPQPGVSTGIAPVRITGSM